MKKRGFVSVFGFNCGIVIIFLGLSGCGGSNSAGPSPVNVPQTFSFTFLTARSGRPVANASVQVEGTDYSTDGAGHVAIQATPGQILAVQATGFLQPRKLRISAGEEIVYLWEDDSTLPSEYTLDIVYRGDRGNRLHRPVATQTVVGVDKKILDNLTAHNAIFAGVAMLNNADGNIQWGVISGNPPNSSSVFSVHLSIDPNDPGFEQFPNTGALAYVDYNGFIGTSGRVVFRSMTFYDERDFGLIVAHELGHTRGLYHTLEGIMGSPYTVNGFSAKERETMRNMFLRNPGTQYPDDSTASGVQNSGSGGGFSRRLVCAFE